ncbi:ABC transporter permease [Nocardia sp. BMG51109]|uniref:ABC transporter permease n=1 Tax=Nocardia sp. BMG51109 TaxID=1056816 RepID=UPI00046418E3|nr:ABC transporter permease [Nocardia sp. BMG51109]
MGVLTAERIKLTSTRSPWWCTASVVVIGLGLAAVFGLVANASYGKEGGLEITMSEAVSGLTGLGVMILMIMATLTVTSEYRFGIIRTTFQATPNRIQVIATKAGLVAVFGAVLTAVLAVLAFGIAKMITGSDAGAHLTLSTAADWRGLIGVPLYAFLGSVLAVAIGALVRQSAAAIALIVLWPMLVEPLAGAFGSFGRNVQPFLPFANMQRFLGGEGAGNWHWGPWGGLIYFTVFVAVVLGAALYTVEKRDA